MWPVSVADNNDDNNNSDNLCSKRRILLYHLVMGRTLAACLSMCIIECNSRVF
jgi:hypothetical protein